MDEDRILKAGLKYPRWGKDEIVVLIRLFIIPLRTPKLQGFVERADRTHHEEFYEVEDISLKMEEHNQQLRSHQSLAYLTPAEYYQGWLKAHPESTVSRM